MKVFDHSGGRSFTHRIDSHLSSLLEDGHGGLDVRPEGGSDGEGNVSKAREDGRLDGSVEELALQVLEQRVHKLVAVLHRVGTQRSADVSDQPDGDRAQLVLLLSLESGREVGHERRDVRVEVLLEG